MIPKAFEPKTYSETVFFIEIDQRKLLIGSIGAKSGHKYIAYYVTEELLPSGYLISMPLESDPPLKY